MERGRSLRSPVRFDAITVPALVLAGERDALIQPPEELATRLPNARLAIVPGDHLTAVAKPESPQRARRIPRRGGASRVSAAAWARGRIDGAA